MTTFIRGDICKLKGYDDFGYVIKSVQVSQDTWIWALWGSNAETIRSIGTQAANEKLLDRPDALQDWLKDNFWQIDYTYVDIKELERKRIEPPCHCKTPAYHEPGCPFPAWFKIEKQRRRNER